MGPQGPQGYLKSTRNDSSGKKNLVFYKFYFKLYRAKESLNTALSLPTTAPSILPVFPEQRSHIPNFHSTYSQPHLQWCLFVLIGQHLFSWSLGHLSFSFSLSSRHEDHKGNFQYCFLQLPSAFCFTLRCCASLRASLLHILDFFPKVNGL